MFGLNSRWTFSFTLISAQTGSHGTNYDPSTSVPMLPTEHSKDLKHSY